MNPTILITGAAGNLGGLLANFLQDRNLHLLTHKKEVSENLKNRSNIQIFKAGGIPADSFVPHSRLPSRRHVVCNT